MIPASLALMCGCRLCSKTAVSKTAEQRANRCVCAKERIVNMDVNTLIQVVGSLGFPIAACVILFYYLNEERKSHKEEMDSVTKSLNNNTQIMLQLKEMVETILRIYKDE